MTTNKKKAGQAAEVNVADTVTGVMFVTGKVGATTYQAGCVITGVPVAVAQAHTNVLNTSAEAVELAKARGAVVVEHLG